MAGGSGSRLWPLSTKQKPKHLLKLFNGKSLIELTIDKLKGHVPNDHIIILTSINYKELTQQTLSQIPPDNFIFEPCIRDTASAIGLAATVLEQRCKDATMIVLTADQIIEPAELFNSAITKASQLLENNPEFLIAFGVKASSPSTLVGWQKLGECLDFPECKIRKIIKFIEKPKLNNAEKFMEEDGYCWNSGQFAWKSKTILQEIYKYMPESIPILKEIGAAWNTKSSDMTLQKLFRKMPTGSIDYKIMQKTKNAYSIFLPCDWEDMGTYAALSKKIGTKNKNNLVSGNAIVIGNENKIFAHTNQSVIVAADDLTVVVTDGVIFVGKSDTDMKSLVENIAEQSPELL